MRIGQARTVSVRPTLLQHRRHGLHEQLDVPAQTPAGDVHVVQLHHLVEGDITPPEHLPQPGDAGRDVEALLRPAAALLSLFHPQGPRPDQTHLALHDIDDLRQLVHAPAPQPAADARDARVAFDLEHRSVVVILVGEIVAQLVSAQVHGAELVDVEGPPSPAHPLLAEEHGAARVELDHKRDDAEHRQHEHADHAADYEIEGALDGHVEATELDMGDVEQGDALDVINYSTRTHDLEEARHDIHPHAGVVTGAHHAQEVVVPRPGEGHDDTVDLLLGDDAVEVAKGADDRHVRTAIAVASRLPIVEEAHQRHAVLRMLADLRSKGVSDLAGADDQDTLLECRSRPHRDPAQPASGRHKDDGQHPEGDERRHRRARWLSRVTVWSRAAFQE